MFGYRKAFVVATFQDLELWNIDYKIILIISQVLGYMLAKFVGIKIISEMPASRRASAILIFIGIAQAALLLFGLVPYPYNFIFLFINGFPLGMIWGLVFGFLEGRRFTEVLGAGLAVSFIVASGFVKSVGKLVLNIWDGSEFWMPFITGLLFTLPMLLFVWMLAKIPPPSNKDEILRTKRVPMNRADRLEFFKTFTPGLILLVVAYIFFTAYRDFRDNFAVEIWNTLGFENKAYIFTISEIPVAFGVLVILGATIFIKNNRTAFWTNHLIIFFGAVCMGLGTIAFQAGLLGPVTWMILVGLGVFLGYVPYNITLFERLIATFKRKSTAGFMIYVADAFGYIGSITVLMYKNFGMSEISYYNFFVNSGYVLAVFSVILLLFSFLYFKHKAKGYNV